MKKKKSEAKEFLLGTSVVGKHRPTYFIAEIGANHDGSLDRAKELCRLAKDAGADAAKFQHFTAETLASDKGFRDLGKLAHQKGWDKSVFESYKAAETPLEWIPELSRFCQDIGIEFLSTPYSIEAADALEPYVSAYKIGSGDITYTKLIAHIARKDKPIILSTGASPWDDVSRAVVTIYQETSAPLVLMQCTTDYRLVDKSEYLNLNVLKTYKKEFKCFTGLSDHGLTYTAVLGAVALGACMVEKHFTDDSGRTGPDHAFALPDYSWKYMIQRVRELERALGSKKKSVTENELETAIVQRRCLRAAHDMNVGEAIQSYDLVALRPAPVDSYPPWAEYKLLGKTIRKEVERGDYLRASDFL